MRIACVHSLRLALTVTISSALALVACGLLFSQEAGQVQKGKGGKGGNALIRPLADVQKDLKGKLERIPVHGRSLEGNLEGDSPDREVFVYLPPSYEAGARRYPVLYLLHGYGLTAERWVGFLNIASLEKNVIAGTAREMILVMPDAFTLYSGSMYSNSATTGYWEKFLTEDLVEYIDKHYRTLADRGSRGLAGHSMGGYGTMRLGMKRADVFSSLYAMSSCCLGATINPNPEQYASLAALKSPAQAKAKGGFMTQFASAAAWSPNPQNPPFFFDLPVKDGVVQPGVVAKWAANAPLAMLDQYVPSLKSYRAIAMDVGLQDSLLNSNRELDALLSKFSIAHTFETYEGDHNSKVAERFDTKVLPFFSRQLTFSPEK
jgi:enterochelin esterase-like enzyme